MKIIVFSFTAVALALLSAPFALTAAFILPALLLLGIPPGLQLARGWRERQETALKSVAENWEALPQRRPIEIVTDLYGAPALISHRDSTEVVYANAAARAALGETLVGRTLYSERSIPSRPVRLNGEAVSCANHPATLVKSQGGKLRAETVWATPTGERPYELQAQTIFRDPKAEYYLLTLQPTDGLASAG